MAWARLITITEEQIIMTSNIVTTNQPDSPFDSIRRYHADGSEYWDARELMSLMGYVKWQRFEAPIKSAIENLEINGDNVSSHFLPLAVSYKGQEKGNYELTRYAAYMIALCCDGRKLEVAAAKKYFATKTREAEIVIPQQNDHLRELELANENMRLMLQWSSRQDNRIALHGLPIAMMLEGKAEAVVEVEKPTIEVFDDRDGQQVKYAGQTCAQLKDYMKSRYGINFKSGADVKRVLEKIEAQTGESLLASTPRKIITDYIPSELSDKAIAYLRDTKYWQMLLG